MNRDFGHWFAGFLDGEGCFTIRTRTQRKGFEFGCEISLRADDRAILREIQSETGLGRIRFKSHHRGPSSLQATWEVKKKAECLALVSLLDMYPLRAKKKRDFVVWREAVQLWSRARPMNNDWSAVEDLRRQLVDGRRFGDPLDDMLNDMLNESVIDTDQLVLLEGVGA